MTLRLTTCLVALLFLSSCVSEDEKTYRAAVKSLEQKQWEQAHAGFSRVGEYKDAKRKILETDYRYYMEAAERAYNDTVVVEFDSAMANLKDARAFYYDMWGQHKDKSYLDRAKELDSPLVYIRKNTYKYDSAFVCFRGGRNYDSTLFYLDKATNGFDDDAVAARRKEAVYLECVGNAERALEFKTFFAGGVFDDGTSDSLMEYKEAIKWYLLALNGYDDGRIVTALNGIHTRLLAISVRNFLSAQKTQRLSTGSFLERHNRETLYRKNAEEANRLYKIIEETLKTAELEHYRGKP